MGRRTGIVIRRRYLRNPITAFDPTGNNQPSQVDSPSARNLKPDAIRQMSNLMRSAISGKFFEVVIGGGYGALVAADGAVP